MVDSDFKSFHFGHKSFPNRGHEHANEDRSLLLLPLGAELVGARVGFQPVVELGGFLRQTRGASNHSLSLVALLCEGYSSCYEGEQGPHGSRYRFVALRSDECAIRRALTPL